MATHQVTSSNVEFSGHGGVVLRGDLYLPSTDGPVPGVVMAHGFSAIKEMALGDYAQVIAESGCAVLVYDHRNLGASEGEPRQEINPWAQARDFRYALTWLAAHDGVDGERLGLWGSSFGGGEVLAVAAIDERVSAVVANVPWAGSGADHDDPVAAFEAMAANLGDESGDGFADLPGRVMGPMPVVADGVSDETPFLDQSESAEWFLPGESLGWKNQVTLSNAFGTEPAFDPAVCAPFIAPAALLMVVATEDRVAPTSLALDTFAAASEPKELVMVEGHHFAPYSGAPLKQAADAAADFFLRHLAESE